MLSISSSTMRSSPKYTYRPFHSRIELKYSSLIGLGDEACSNHPRGDPRVEEEDTQIGVLAEVDQGEAEPELGED